MDKKRVRDSSQQAGPDAKCILRTNDCHSESELAAIATRACIDMCNKSAELLDLVFPSSYNCQCHSTKNDALTKKIGKVLRYLFVEHRIQIDWSWNETHWLLLSKSLVILKMTSCTPL